MSPAPTSSHHFPEVGWRTDVISGTEGKTFRESRRAALCNNWNVGTSQRILHPDIFLSQCSVVVPASCHAVEVWAWSSVDIRLEASGFSVSSQTQPYFEGYSQSTDIVGGDRSWNEEMHLALPQTVDELSRLRLPLGHIHLRTLEWCGTATANTILFIWEMCLGSIAARGNGLQEGGEQELGYEWALSILPAHGGLSKEMLRGVWKPVQSDTDGDASPVASSPWTWCRWEAELVPLDPSDSVVLSAVTTADGVTATSPGHVVRVRRCFLLEKSSEAQLANLCNAEIRGTESFALHNDTDILVAF